MRSDIQWKDVSSIHKNRRTTSSTQFGSLNVEPEAAQVTETGLWSKANSPGTAGNMRAGGVNEYLSSRLIIITAVSKLPGV